MKKLNLPPVYCSTCGIPVSIPSMLVYNQTNHFCSRRCLWIGKRNGLAIRASKKKEYICEVCKSPFLVLDSRAKRFSPRFCSRRCQGISKREELQGKNSARYNQASFNCLICGKEFFRKASRIGKAKTCSNPCRFRLMSLINEGAGNPSYIHGKSNEPYPIEFSKNLRNSIIIRDGESCIECGIGRKEHKDIYGFDLNVHHIDFNKKNIDKQNLLSLCLSCHGKTHKKPIEQWITKYKQYMEKVYG